MAGNDASGLTYEGIGIDDARAQEERWLAGMDLPGERVRFDVSKRVADPTPLAGMRALGVAPLVISKSVVRGFETSDGMGGTRAAVALEYEFEGKEGRHDAGQFIEEGGRDHMYGVLLVRDDRTWAVPIRQDDDGVAHWTGPAREIVGFAGRTDGNLHPDGFAAMRSDVAAENGISGEFYSQPRDGFRAPGPIVLLGSPWTSGVDDDERAIADAAIDAAIVREERLRDDPVRLHFDEMAPGHAAFRERRPVEEHDSDIVSTLEASMEANHLTQGRDRSDANVRMAAAMHATEGREGVKGLTSHDLADSMMPTAELGRRSTIARQAAALDVAHASSKGPVPDAAMPPFGAAMTRRGGAER